MFYRYLTNIWFDLNSNTLTDALLRTDLYNVSRQLGVKSYTSAQHSVVFVIGS